MQVRVDRSETDRAQYAFKVAEFADGTPWIKTEPAYADLKILQPQKGSLGFDLRKGTTFEQAEEIARFLNEHIEAISCTTFPGGYDIIKGDAV